MYRGLSLLSLLVVAGLAGCGGSGKKGASPHPATALTGGQVERAFAKAGLPLVASTTIDLSPIPAKVRSRMAAVSPIVLLRTRLLLRKGDYIDVVVGRSTSGGSYSIGFGSSQDLETGRVISPSPGNVSKVENIVVGSRVESNTLIDKLSVAIGRLDKAAGF